MAYFCFENMKPYRLSLLVAKKANSAWPSGKASCTSLVLRSGGKTISTGSRRTAISRRIDLLRLADRAQLASCLACSRRASFVSSTTGFCASSVSIFLASMASSW